MPKLINNTGRPITVVFNGQKTIIPMKAIIDGPVQLTMYGLSVISAPINSVQASIGPQSNSFFEVNKKEVNKAIDFIKKYDDTQKSSIGVCILSKDSYDLIKECIDSIEEKVQYDKTKIYIFDTGTTDQKVLDFYDQKTKSCKFPFKVINVGKFQFSTNYNDGIKQVDTEYVIIQNNDTVAVNDYISRLVKLSLPDKIGICGPRMFHKDNTIQHDGQIIYDHIKKGFTQLGHVHHRDTNKPGGRHLTDGITGAGLVIKKSYFFELGGFDTKFRDLYQDVDFNVKSRMAGKMTICDRDSVIYHYDNTSRKDLWNDPDKLKAMKDDAGYINEKIGTTLKYTERKKHKFSIVTLVNNKDVYTDFLNDLMRQNCRFNFEVIALPNFSNEYQSCSEALNIGLDISESDYVIMCHQDLRVNPSWLSNIADRIKDLKVSNVNFGVLGIAGSSLINNVDTDALYLDYIFAETVKYYGNYKEIQTLDELCLIVQKDNDIRFDEKNFDHYHVYGADLCLQYLEKGFKNFSINAPCKHISVDGLGNLLKQDLLDKFIEANKRLYFKWKTKFKTYRTMTSIFDKNSIKFYSYSVLKEKGLDIEETIFLK